MKPKKCKICGEEFTPAYSTLQSYCTYACANKGQKEKRPKRKRIAPVSERRRAENIKYKKLRAEFLSQPVNKFCFIEGCGKKATTVEHTAGRIGSNFLDVTTWRACCLAHNIELEVNPALSKKYQVSKIHPGKKI